ncbi:GNAT family N-acetyltransferase [Agrobacterium rhizogenes]|uniref:GNAT family N-acetyltransferase n=1 Tax=Rhizobium rhizogenes TaxID=359 RepID=UPI00157376D3|nr:GNAT family N-acetyltransferase [Rhizobium rhizogenes]NTH68537.1 GNAT family N-acetyltransferase [Rhizobium rhizogenes]NTI07153.1 GNAT family N-acetyltransferase [Rhizobium rhizogenes]NTI13967.1 GNAT family N-acetyltransferase [Rhizobium rhizogenes]
MSTTAIRSVSKEGHLRDAQVAMLDNPVWSALTMDQQTVSKGGRFARRYEPALSVFAAMEQATPDAYAELGTLLTSADKVALFTTQILNPPTLFDASMLGEGYQMVAQNIPERAPETTLQCFDLAPADVPDMQELVDLTKPGPFTARTIELGRYLGIRQEGALVAMIGERMRFGGLVEVSAVCVHPDHRGKRLAQMLTVELCTRIRSDGGIPFLHVYAANQSAIALYEKLGFVKRRRLHVTGLSLASADPIKE